MARTTPAQKPRGEHSSTVSGGLWSGAPVIRTSVGRAALDMRLWPASVKRGHARFAVALLAAQPRLVAGAQLRGVRRGVVMDDRRQRATGGFEASGHVAVRLGVGRKLTLREQLVQGLRRSDEIEPVA